VRHRVYGKHLGRNKNERTALFKNLVQSLLLHGSIETTEAKAKSIKGLVDKIINQAKSKNTQRLLSSFFQNKEIREKLIKRIAPSMKDRNSGYTSLVKMGQRKGDNAMMVRMSLLMEESDKDKSKIKNQDSKVQVKSEKSENKQPVIASAAKQSSSDKTPIKIASPRQGGVRNDNKKSARKAVKK